MEEVDRLSKVTVGGASLSPKERRCPKCNSFMRAHMVDGVTTYKCPVCGRLPEERQK